MTLYLVGSRPADPFLRARLAQTFMLKASEIDDENPVEAIRLYQRAIHFDAMCLTAYVNLGRVLYLRGQRGAAEIWWLRALEIDEYLPDANYNLGFIRLEQGLFAAAVTYLERTLATDEKFADAHYYLADALDSLGHKVRARRHWRRYLQLGGTDREEVQRRLGMVLVQGGKT